MGPTICFIISGLGFFYSIVIMPMKNEMASLKEIIFALEVKVEYLNTK